ncbi:hypothetical protein DOK67_0000150 [Enterococcus sp. DIV0212c]|uniref:hypothetical protein n=1 Tax=Enterococcus sp. DIV0212c TaxID=2230867 RepID=UPI001A9B829D|nr:hypothetical protein [Enterococcus sp. DIV0212c]MBO1353998.1 hypothetical protein [Enterococcus sp. DIV0212c]
MLIDFHDKNSSIEFLKRLFKLNTFTKNNFINDQGYLDSELHISEKTFDEFKMQSLVTYHITKCSHDDILRNGLLPISQVLDNDDSEISRFLASQNIKLDMRRKILSFSNESIPLDCQYKSIKFGAKYEYISLCNRVERDHRVDCFYTKPLTGNEYSVIHKTPEILFDIGKVTNTYSYFEQAFYHSKLNLVTIEMKLSDANINKKRMIDILDDLLDFIFNNHYSISSSSVISTKTGVMINPDNILSIEEL